MQSSSFQAQRISQTRRTKRNAPNEQALRARSANDLKDWEEAINHYLKIGRR